jgi:hypothetical protein
MLKPYATLLRTPGALKFSTAGFIGRMPIAMDSLAIIFIVVAATDSYALAGALTAVGSIVVALPKCFGQEKLINVDRQKFCDLLYLFELFHFSSLFFWSQRAHRFGRGLSL